MSITNFWASSKRFFAKFSKIKEISFTFASKQDLLFRKMQTVLEFDRNSVLKSVRYTGKSFEIEFFERRRIEPIAQEELDNKKKSIDRVKKLRAEEDAVAELAATDPMAFEDAVGSKALTRKEGEKGA